MQEQFDNFFASYEIDNIIFHPDSKPALTPKLARICRFCGQSMPTVKFKSEAHTIPQLTGNQNMVSDFECDTCNNHLSLYETHLGAILGISRTLTTLHGQRGVPGYKSQDKKFEVWWEKGEKKLKASLEFGVGKYPYKIDKKRKQLSIFAVKQSYIPLYVFKSLLKMGLCYVEPADLSLFDRAFRLIRDEQLNARVAGVQFFKGYFSFFSGASLPAPLLFCFKRRSDARVLNCPNYYFALYFGNYIIQWAMPLYDPDESIFLAARKVDVQICPPLLGKTVLDIVGVPKVNAVDLNSDHLKKNENDKIVMSFTSIERPKGSRIKNLYYWVRYWLRRVWVR